LRDKKRKEKKRKKGWVFDGEGVGRVGSRGGRGYAHSSSVGNSAVEM
jgi:hypothetical protein